MLAALAFAAFAGAIGAAPAEPAGISVERSAGAETCADAYELADRTGLRIGAPALDPEGITAADVALAPGTVRVSFLGARTLGCLRIFGGVSDLAVIDGCATATLGRLSASGTGFLVNRTAPRPWFAGGLAAVGRG